MSDIEKCLNGCTKRLLCKRWTSPSGERQTVRDIKPDAETGICEAYWPNAVAETDAPAGHFIHHNED